MKSSKTYADHLLGFHALAYNQISYKEFSRKGIQPWYKRECAGVLFENYSAVTKGTEFFYLRVGQTVVELPTMQAMADLQADLMVSLERIAPNRTVTKKADETLKLTRQDSKLWRKELREFMREHRN